MSYSTNTPSNRCPFCGAELERFYVELGEKQYSCGFKPCQCEGAQREREREKAEERQRELEEQAQRRQRRLAATGIPPRYWEATTDRLDLVEDAKTKGLYIQGPVGTGKTELASAIGIKLMDEGFKVLFVKAADLVDMMSQFADNLEAVKAIQDPDLLIIDDIGMEETRDWSDRRLRRAIDARWDTAKPVIGTSNYTKQQLACIKGQTDETNADAIVSRLFGMTTKVELAGKDRRMP